MADDGWSAGSGANGSGAHGSGTNGSTNGAGSNGTGTMGYRPVEPDRSGVGAELLGLDPLGLGVGNAVPVIGPEAQLIALYAERDQLQQAIGTADADEIIELVTNATEGRASMTAQLESLYAERDLLHRELGTADADAIVALVANLRRRLGVTLEFVDELLDQLKEPK